MGVEPGDRILAMLLTLSEGLRAAGMDVAMVEVLDAAEALRHVELGDRPLVRAVLRATLVKHLEHETAFDVLFDRCFPVSRPTRPATSSLADGGEPHPPLAGGGRTTGPAGGASEQGDDGDAARTDLLEALLRALRDGDHAMLEALAAEAVTAYGGLGEASGSERYYLYRVLRALDLAALLSAAMRMERAEGDGGSQELTWRLRRDELTRHIDELRRLLAREVRGRFAPGDLASLAPPRRLDELDLVDASRADLQAMREAVRPLARKLAAKVAQRRRQHRGGRLDMRRTVRRSLAYGGVPMDPAFRRRRASKADVVLLCDLSGSVAEFASFTLALVHALHAELARLRTFVFVDGVAEVTDLLQRADGVPDTFHLLSRAGVVTGDGHSDYGRVFECFGERHARTTGPSTTVIITGDARTNHRRAGLDAFQELCTAVKAVYWLNPEPRAQWGDDDSAMGDYAATCTKVFEVRSLRQLGTAVAEII